MLTFLGKVIIIKGNSLNAMMKRKISILFTESWERWEPTISRYVIYTPEQIR